MLFECFYIALENKLSFLKRNAVSDFSIEKYYTEYCSVICVIYLMVSILVFCNLEGVILDEEKCAKLLKFMNFSANMCASFPTYLTQIHE